MRALTLMIMDTLPTVSITRSIRGHAYARSKEQRTNLHHWSWSCRCLGAVVYTPRPASSPCHTSSSLPLFQGVRMGIKPHVISIHPTTYPHHSQVSTKLHGEVKMTDIRPRHCPQSKLLLGPTASLPSPQRTTRRPARKSGCCCAVKRR